MLMLQVHTLTHLISILQLIQIMFLDSTEGHSDVAGKHAMPQTAVDEYNKLVHPSIVNTRFLLHAGVLGSAGARMKNIIHPAIFALGEFVWF